MTLLATKLKLSKSIARFLSTVQRWVLDGGKWNDTGKWLDSKKWKDNA